MQRVDSRPRGFIVTHVARRAVIIVVYSHVTVVARDTPTRCRCSSLKRRVSESSRSRGNAPPIGPSLRPMCSPTLCKNPRTSARNLLTAYQFVISLLFLFSFFFFSSSIVETIVDEKRKERESADEERGNVRVFEALQRGRDCNENEDASAELNLYVSHVVGFLAFTFDGGWSCRTF